VSLESRARAPLGLNDSRDYPELLEHAAEIANKNAAGTAVTQISSALAVRRMFGSFLSRLVT
jgi:hypothetical protein